MVTNPISLQTLFGKTRSSVLGLLFSRPTERFHVRQIERLTRAGIGPVQRELRLLLETGLLTREKEGNQVYFQANQTSPVFEELKGLVLKTVGVAELLRAALFPMAAEIVAAYLFGSLARGQQTSQSDADVLIISETLTMERVIVALRDAQKQIGREINPVIYRRAEFRSKLSRKQPFLTRVMKEPKVLLAGDERGLGAMG